MFCPQCGDESPGESRFCFQCGHSLEAVKHRRALEGRPVGLHLAESKHNFDSSSSVSRRRAVGLLVLALAALFSIWVFTVRPPSPQKGLLSTPDATQQTKPAKSDQRQDEHTSVGKVAIRTVGRGPIRTSSGRFFKEAEMKVAIGNVLSSANSNFSAIKGREKDRGKEHYRLEWLSTIAMPGAESCSIRLSKANPSDPGTFSCRFELGNQRVQADGFYNGLLSTIQQLSGFQWVEDPGPWIDLLPNLSGGAGAIQVVKFMAPLSTGPQLVAYDQKRWFEHQAHSPGIEVQYLFYGRQDKKYGLILTIDAARDWYKNELGHGR